MAYEFTSFSSKFLGFKSMLKLLLALRSYLKKQYRPILADIIPQQYG